MEGIATLKILRALLDDPGSPRYGLELIRASGVKAGRCIPSSVVSRLERGLRGDGRKLTSPRPGDVVDATTSQPAKERRLRADFLSSSSPS